MLHCTKASLMPSKSSERAKARLLPSGIAAACITKKAAKSGDSSLIAPFAREVCGISARSCRAQELGGIDRARLFAARALYRPTNCVRRAPAWQRPEMKRPPTGAASFIALGASGAWRESIDRYPCRDHGDTQEDNHANCN